LEIRQKITLDGIKLFLDDSLTTLLIRKSGTEPLLRFYIESDTKEYLERVKKFVKMNVG
jgi:phosphomannomutase